LESLVTPPLSRLAAPADHLFVGQWQRVNLCSEKLFGDPDARRSAPSASPPLFTFFFLGKLQLQQTATAEVRELGSRGTDRVRLMQC